MYTDMWMSFFTFVLPLIEVIKPSYKKKDSNSV